MKQKDWDHIRMSPILLQQRENYSHINANTVEDIKNSSDEFLNVEFMHKMQNKTQITTLSIYVVWQPNAAQVK